jgi:predicted methyltransferase
MTKARYALMTALLLDLTGGVAAVAIPIQATPERIFEAARIKSGQTVCEIGAGVGDLALAAARIAGPEGRVFANELEGRLPALRIRVSDSNLSTVTVVTGEPTKTGIPDGACDAVIMKDVYHHFVEPAAMNRAIAAALKPGGRLVVVDFTPPGKEAATPAARGADGTHGVLPATVIAEVSSAGFRNEPAGSSADRWYLLVFVKGNDSRGPGGQTIRDSRSRFTMAGRVSAYAVQTDRHQSSIARSRAGPGGASSTSAAVTRPRSPGSATGGHSFFSRASR